MRAKEDFWLYLLADFREAALSEEQRDEREGRTKGVQP